MRDGQAVPKVIDFGLAKAVQAKLTDRTVFTQFGQAIGTLQYMSPEQTRVNELDIDTRSDIYSLGAMLYELLTGTTPLEQSMITSGGTDEALQLIRDSDPPRPSRRLVESGRITETVCENRGCELRRHQRQLHGELDWIAMKALEKDRTRRYETASELAADIQRYLDGNAVLARPPSRRYLLGKLLRKNKGPVAAAALILFLLVAGLLGTGFGLRRALHEEAKALASADDAVAARVETEKSLKRANAAEELANKRADDLQKISAFQQQQLAEIDPVWMGSELRQSILNGWHRSLIAEGSGGEDLDRQYALAERILATVTIRFHGDWEKPGRQPR